MKILIFEYITGGGFCGTELPASLAREGGLMLNALLADFAELHEHDVVMLCDSRCIPVDMPQNIRLIPVNVNANVDTIFDNALQDCDAAWIIAPETEHILFNFTQRVEKAKKLLLSSPSSAIAKTADKLQTFNILTAHSILTIPTQHLSDFLNFKHWESLYELPLVIKPIDGVGCENSFFIQNPLELNHALPKITQPQDYIIQPFMSGDAFSISALFNQGIAQLLCVNRQVITIEHQQFKLIACHVNIAVEKNLFQTVLNKIAHAFSDLFGYVGIDLIISNLMPNAVYIVEINPRLTSSYAGIKKALEINIAALILQSLSGISVINPLRNQTTLIEIIPELS